MTEGGRARIAGAAAVKEALARGAPLRWIVVDGEAGGEAGETARALLAPARAAGVPVQRVGHRHFARLCPPEARGAVALLGEPPARDPAELLARAGPAWLLAGVVYPGNTGMAIRTAEVSGAAGVFIDAGFDHEQRREALRASMRADRFLPVLWEPAGRVLDAARAAGRRLVALEDSGAAAPWELDLRGPVLFVVGGEFDGIPPELLGRCDVTLRIPMAGFIRSYNLQAAVAVVAAERMRQNQEAER